MDSVLKELLEQEEQLQFDSFSNEDALQLGLIIIEIVKTNYQNEGKRGVAINIERNGQVLFTHLMEGASNEFYSWFGRKKRIVERYDHSSHFVGEKFRLQGTTVNEASFLPGSEYQAVGGSFPIFVKNTGAIGNVSISGLTSEEDHNICVEALTKLLEMKSNKK